MKKIIIGLGILTLNIFANQFNKNECTETQLGNTTTYIVQCKENQYKVTYDSGFKNRILDFVELGKGKKYNRTPAKGGEMQRAHNKTY